MTFCNKFDKNYLFIIYFFLPPSSHWFSFLSFFLPSHFISFLFFLLLSPVIRYYPLLFFSLPFPFIFFLSILVLSSHYYLTFLIFILLFSFLFFFHNALLLLLCPSAIFRSARKGHCRDSAIRFVPL